MGRGGKHYVEWEERTNPFSRNDVPSNRNLEKNEYREKRGGKVMT